MLKGILFLFSRCGITKGLPKVAKSQIKMELFLENHSPLNQFRSLFISFIFSQNLFAAVISKLYLSVFEVNLGRILLQPNNLQKSSHSSLNLKNFDKRFFIFSQAIIFKSNLSITSDSLNYFLIVIYILTCDSEGLELMNVKTNIFHIVLDRLTSVLFYDQKIKVIVMNRLFRQN
jgi:hypothetical protein